MNHRGQILRSSRRPLWESILDRHKYRGRLLRPRVPLVFRRVSSPANFYQRPRLLRPVVQYPFNLHLQFAWPLLSVEKTRFRETIKQSSVIRSHLQRTQSTSSQTMPASVQLASLIKSYAIVTEQRNQLQMASTIFKSAGRIPLPLPPAALDQSNHANVRSAFAHSARNPNLPTHVEPGKAPQIESGKTPTQVESGKTSVRGEDRKQTTFPEVVIMRRRLTAVREIVTPRPLVTASAPGSLSHQTPASVANAGVSAQTVGSSKSFPNIRRRETLLHAEVFRSSRVNTDIASPHVRASVTTSHTPTVKTESTRGSFVPSQQRLYWQPAARDFASVPAQAEEKQSTPEELPSLSQRASVPQPTLDIGQLSEEVYRHIQRKLRIERERRGL